MPAGHAIDREEYMRTAILSRQNRRRADRTASRLLLALAAAAVFAAVMPAQEADPGRVVQAPLPVTTEAVNQLGRATDDALDRFEAALKEKPNANAPVFKLIYDFNPDGKPSNSNDFGACTNLVDEIRRVQGRGARTIAYIHGPVTRHSVLPVLACDEIVFSAEGKLGEVVEPGEALARSKRVAYEEVAGSRWPQAVVLKMLDRNLVIVKAKPQEKGPRYRAASDKPDDGVVLPAGTAGLYNFEQASMLGLCQPDARESIADVAAAYQLPRSALDPILVRTKVVWLLPVEGTLTSELKERMIRRVRRALGAGANTLIFHLKCHGGDSGAAADLATYIADLNETQRDNPVRTIAFVSPEASDTALFLALACNQILMAPQAKLGDFDVYLREHPDRVDVIRKNLDELARRQLYSAALVQGMVDPSARIAWAVRRKGASGGKPMTIDELDRDAAGGDPQWRNEYMIKPMDARDEGKCLTLPADLAKKVGLARDVVEDLNAVYKREGMSAPQVTVAGGDWLDDLANFLRDPWTSMVLVMVGITCLIIELKMPGVGLPGVLAAVCFVLFFWSHSQLNGQMVWLAILLFLLGLVLLGLEIFVLPGFGVCGVSGILLVIGSLGLVAYGHWPRSNQEWLGLGRAMGPFGLSILGAIACAMFLVRYLPNIPYANRLILKSAVDSEGYADEASAAVANELAGLLGAIGVAATPLRPAGKAQFGDDFVDVVAEGSYVPPGTRVRVIEIEGNRVVVKEV